MNLQQKALHLLLDKETKDSDFDNHLQENISKACKLLNLYESQIENLIPELKYNENCFDSVRYKFISLCFHLLLTSDDNSEIQNVSHMIDIKKSFQFIVSLGILPNLIPGIGLSMNIRFKNADKFPSENLEVHDKFYRLCSITKLMLKCLEINKLRNYIIENHFCDILAALLQLTAAPLKKPDDSTEKFYMGVLDKRKEFKSDLHDLILTSHQPLVFRELMFLFGNEKSPVWLKNYVIQILMERLEAKNGVESFIRAMLDVQTNDTGMDWKHWDITVKILMTKPKYANENDYYKNICGQLIKLLYKKTFDGQRIPHFEKANVLCTKYLYELNEDLCIKFLLKPLIDLLVKYTDQVDIETVRLFPSEEIERNISVLHDIFVGEKTIPSSHLQPIIFLLYNLFIGCKNLKMFTQDISELIHQYLNDSEMKSDLFNYFLFKDNPKTLPDIRKNYQFNVISEQIQYIIKTEDLDMFSRANDCFQLLETTKNDELITNFVIYLFKKFIEHFQSNNIETIEKKLVISYILTKLLENKTILKSISKKPTELLIFCENLLKALTDKSVHIKTDCDDEQYQVFFTTLMITNTIVKNSDKIDIQSDFIILYNILNKIFNETINSEVKSLVNEIISVEKVTNQRTEYDEALDEICSTLIPEQAHGLARLVKLIDEKDEKTLQKKQYILNIFQQHLKSDETFLYLRAIAGLATIADAFPGTILETLIDEYANPKGATEKDLETRMKLGEVLVRVTMKLGEIAVKYKAVLLNCFLTVAKDNDPLIRASALSNLAQVCEVLGFRLGTMVIEILNCVHDVISHELAVEVRRAAVTVIRQLFIGLGNEMLAFLKEDILPIYRTLKKVYYDDPDDVTRLQAQLAIEELNKIMKDLLAPEIKLEKAFVL